MQKLQNTRLFCRLKSPAPMDCQFVLAHFCFVDLKLSSQQRNKTNGVAEIGEIFERGGDAALPILEGFSEFIASPIHPSIQQSQTNCQFLN